MKANDCPACGGPVEVKVVCRFEHVVRCASCGSEAVLFDQMWADWGGVDGSTEFWNRKSKDLSVGRLAVAANPGGFRWNLRR